MDSLAKRYLASWEQLWKGMEDQLDYRMIIKVRVPLARTAPLELESTQKVATQEQLREELWW